jgi:hypothetical protein
MRGGSVIGMRMAVAAAVGVKVPLDV